MPRKIINPPQLAPPRGFSHGILASGGRILFLAGQDASDAQGHIVAPGDLVAQFEQALHNVQTVIEEAGGQMQNVVKLNIFVRDRDAYLSELKRLGVVYRRFFGDYYPAMAFFEVCGFFQDDNLVELEGIAYLD